jgi:hypothetical protein
VISRSIVKIAIIDAASVNSRHDGIATTASAARRLAHRPDLEDSLSSTNDRGLHQVRRAVPADFPSSFPGRPRAQGDYYLDLWPTNDRGLRPVRHAVPGDSPSWFQGHPKAQEDCCPSHERMTRTPGAD